jgi:hypothetical protein
MNASLSRDLAAGTYYVVLEAFGNMCGMMRLDLSTPTTSCPNFRQASETESESNESSKAKLQEMNNMTKTINVYPNPSFGDIVVDLNESTDATVVLVDMLGQVVAEKQIPAGSNSFKFDGSHLAKGMYIVKVLGSKLSKTVLIK